MDGDGKREEILKLSSRMYLCLEIRGMRRKEQRKLRSSNHRNKQKIMGVSRPGSQGKNIDFKE